MQEWVLQLVDNQCLLGGNVDFGIEKSNFRGEKFLFAVVVGRVVIFRSFYYSKNTENYCAGQIDFRAFILLFLFFCLPKRKETKEKGTSCPIAPRDRKIARRWLRSLLIIAMALVVSLSLNKGAIISSTSDRLSVFSNQSNQINQCNLRFRQSAKSVNHD
jgi:hypothetical protein